MENMVNIQYHFGQVSISIYHKNIAAGLQWHSAASMAASYYY